MGKKPFNIQYSIFKILLPNTGMTGLDRRSPLLSAMPRMLENSLNLEHQVCAKNTLAKAKAIVSPYFGANAFAPAYAFVA
jgi:hypothetical protein